MTEPTPAPEAPGVPVSPEVPVAPDAPASSFNAAWGRKASRTYLILCAIILAAMAIETVTGHAGAASILAAIFAVPWSMLAAAFAPAIPADLPMATGLGIRMGLLALFMLLNAAIVAGIAARTERDIKGSRG
jgi:hypothetical protein